MESRLLHVFVYGTLKRGQRNHDSFCRGAVDVREARVCGRLYDLALGFPVLVVPEGSIQAVGTEDYAGDAGKHRSEVRASPSPEPVVYGELMTFDDPTVRLLALDSLEEFRPGAAGLYRRVLIPVQTDGEALTAWAYAAKLSAGKHLSGGRWPP